ncbi:hypothetical protein SAMN05660216_00104 [Pseudomonas sp. LAMO17WK12:I8]|nr:hypothetical protein SAMN05660216_00104 [Pseudomonas sp. LAMO17WK12:I8]SNX99876.1 hypothetical protein SAMN05660893_00105 [Pseudomonas sp. LAMO17WK12:I12]SNY00332.1 hypothetical protein SAMN05660344_00105 [Pseudomonas sp. LAMO17WK12:I11]SNY03556.1 hypothetical protein SAMN05660700_00795 [Pseudomonas sp. LAMO17WK12:I7]
MQLSIRDASRFVIGAGLMREKAIEASGNPAISFGNVAQAALRQGPDGQKIRQTIDTLADQESAYLRATPSHTLSSDRVMQSREAEVNVFTAIHRAVIGSVNLEAASPSRKSGAEADLHQSLLDAFEAIDNTPGSRTDREGLLASVREQVIAASSDADGMKRMLRDSEQRYLAADLDKTFARYANASLPRSESSNDYSM